MPKKSGIIFVIIGAVLILSALFLFLYNGYEDRRAGQEAELLLQDIQSAIAKDVPAATDRNENEPPSVKEKDMGPAGAQETMPAVQIDEYEYIGYLSIPYLELELPVMAEWDYKRLKIAPCRHMGSSRTDDLVIAAHNYATHFGSLSDLETGTAVIFTDMEGIANHYVLAKGPETLAPDAVDAVLKSGYDLVLYTCTPGGAARVAAFFDRVQDETGGHDGHF